MEMSRVYLVNLGGLLRRLTTEAGKQTVGRVSEDDDRVCVIQEFDGQKWLIIPDSKELDRYEVLQMMPEEHEFKASLDDIERDFG